MEEEKHFPPGTEEAKAAEEAAQAQAAAEAKASEEQAAKEAADAEAKAKEEEAAKAEADAKAKVEEEANKVTKKRSIYDDYKDEKGKRKSAEEVAAAEKARADAAEAELAKARAERPADAAAKKGNEPTDELKTFAEEQGLDPEQVTRLADIIAQRIPSSQLTEEEKKDLADLRSFKERTEAESQRKEEDQAILSQSSKIKDQLSIHDDAELATVMAEIIKLAHTAEFADKEVEYIAWKKRDELSKLVSPKKPSFEAGGQRADGAPETEEVDFSKGGKLTPEQAQKGMVRTKSSVEVRSSQS